MVCPVIQKSVLIKVFNLPLHALELHQTVHHDNEHVFWQHFLVPLAPIDAFVPSYWNLRPNFEALSLEDHR